MCSYYSNQYMQDVITDKRCHRIMHVIAVCIYSYVYSYMDTNIQNIRGENLTDSSIRGIKIFPVASAVMKFPSSVTEYFICS